MPLNTAPHPRATQALALVAVLPCALSGACTSKAPSNTMPQAPSGMSATPTSQANAGSGVSTTHASGSGAGGSSQTSAGRAGSALGSAGTTAASGGASGGAADSGAAQLDDAGVMPDAANAGTSSLPDVMDFEKPGPFTPVSADGPSGYVLFYPQELGKDGVKHPIVSWGPGAAEDAGIFSTLLNHLASHGFAVISYDGTPQGQELITAIDWMLAENSRSDSMFYQKLDATKIAAGGHSAGSLATFVVAGDKRLTTTLHISGGTFDPHTDIMNLHAPALMICGEPGGDGLLMGDVANPNCEIDFQNAMVPVFFGITKGAAHMTPTDIGDATIRAHQLGAMVGWLRWQLAGDEHAKHMFVGDSCSLCQDANWSEIKQKQLN